MNGPAWPWSDAAGQPGAGGDQPRLRHVAAQGAAGDGAADAVPVTGRAVDHVSSRRCSAGLPAGSAVSPSAGHAAGGVTAGDNHAGDQDAELAPGTNGERRALDFLAFRQLVHEPLADRVGVIGAAVVVDAVALDDDRPLAHQDAPGWPGHGGPAVILMLPHVTGVVNVASGPGVAEPGVEPFGVGDVVQGAPSVAAAPWEFGGVAACPGADGGGGDVEEPRDRAGVGQGSGHPLIMADGVRNPALIRAS